MTNEVQSFQIQAKTKYNLEEWQVKLLEAFMLPKALRPSRDRLVAELGITQQQYYYWLRHPKLTKAKREMVKTYFLDYVPDVLMAMKNEAVSGNERAARLFLEYVDDFKNNDPNVEPPLRLPKSEVNIIINKLEQKFYGKKPGQNKLVEGQE